MSKLVMNDLPVSVEPDRTALKTISGGYRYTMRSAIIGNYAKDYGGGDYYQQPTGPVKECEVKMDYPLMDESAQQF